MAQGARVIDLDEYRRRRVAKADPSGAAMRAPAMPMVWIPLVMWIPCAFWPMR